MKVREILQMLHNDGWYEIDAHTKGSHIQMKHPSKPGKVSVPNHNGDVPKGTLGSIKRQAGL